ncbi:MAG: porphobilinogen synthase, partial [Pseudomonadota bacterium]|nr:porphobilinogen synthase [Pseudomonadota bacterium]
MSYSTYPSLRMRRGRSSGWMREMLAEHRLHPSDLIWPLFVCEGESCEEPIVSLPGVSRWSVDLLAAKAREAAALGIPCIALFPNTPGDRRTEDASEALNPDNLICRAIRAIKDSVPEIGVLTDVALDPYTSHGHDGLVDDRGCVANDETVKVLTEQALVQASAGADIVAPSDMMDGRVGAIREALEGEGYCDVAIMAYAAKYASAFYGPFRDAVGSLGRLKGDKRGYQMNPANGEEALREVELDLAEGADMVMV